MSLDDGYMKDDDPASFMKDDVDATAATEASDYLKDSSDGLIKDVDASDGLIKDEEPSAGLSITDSASGGNFEKMLTLNTLSRI